VMRHSSVGRKPRGDCAVAPQACERLSCLPLEPRIRA
jgi:hypothetical protein